MLLVVLSAALLLAATGATYALAAGAEYALNEVVDVEAGAAVETGATETGASASVEEEDEAGLPE